MTDVRTAQQWEARERAYDSWFVSALGDDGDRVLVADKIDGEANARLIAAAPKMLDALKDAERLIGLAKNYFPKSIRNSDKFTLLNTGASITKAIYRAEGSQQRQIEFIILGNRNEEIDARRT